MLRNKEVRRFAAILLSIAIIFVILGFKINIYAGILFIMFAVAFSTAFFMFTRDRYKQIAEVSNQIDMVLHNIDHVYIGELDEGELSILHSEIIKMTTRLREQNYALKKEKENLSNSLADISHQLRTPLTSVNIILSLLESDSDESKKKLFLREAEELLLKMDWLITSLLKLSRLDAGIIIFKSENIYVNELIKTAIRPLLIPIELHNIEIEMDLSKEVSIQGDIGWLSEAIQNILKNCMENVGDHGKIKIKCTENPLFNEIIIHDSGTGFEKEEIPFLFERFYRGNNKRDTGYGIGLALCKMIIVRQGGSVTAKNYPQGGAIFIIRFPK